MSFQKVRLHDVAAQFQQPFKIAPPPGALMGHLSRQFQFFHWLLFGQAARLQWGLRRPIFMSQRFGGYCLEQPRLRARVFRR